MGCIYNANFNSLKRDIVWSIIEKSLNLCLSLIKKDSSDNEIRNSRSKFSYQVVDEQQREWKQVRINIGLADTLIPSSCDSSKIIYGNDV